MGFWAYPSSIDFHESRGKESLSWLWKAKKIARGIENRNKKKEEVRNTWNTLGLVELHPRLLGLVIFQQLFEHPRTPYQQTIDSVIFLDPL